MGRAAWIPLAVLALAGGVLPQAPPSSSSFELTLPDFNLTVPSGSVVADIPARPITRLTIQLLGTASSNLNYGDIRVRINGIGAGSLFNRGSNEKGKFLAMDPSTLRMRRDPIFDPRENAIEVYGKDPRGRAYYQNWILRTHSEDLNAYFTYISSLSPDDETGVPPDLILQEPSAPIAAPDPGRPLSVRVKGSASAASGIKLLTLNGKPLPAAGKPLREGDDASISFAQQVAVEAGAKSLVIEALDRKGNRRSITLPVIYPPKGPAPRLAGQAWAIVIGISSFSSKATPPPPVPAAAFDAQELASTLRNHGLNPKNIRVLVNEQATLEQFRTALGDFAAQAKPEDLLLLYVSTQGVHDPAHPELVYLAASDTQGLHLGETAIESSELQLLLNRGIRSRHTILFFDVEHNLGGEWTFHGESIVNTRLLELFDGPLGRSVLVSGGANQVSQERTKGQSPRSVFSTALIDALSGEADIDRNHVLTPKELCSFVAERVRRETGGKQEPQYRYSDAEAEAPVLSLR
jgi:hypothetical protein